MTITLESGAMLRRFTRRATRVGLLASLVVIPLLDSGCGWPLRPRPVPPPLSECRMQVRLASDPAMAPITIFTGQLLMDPFGFQITGCGDPSSVNAQDTWERLVERTLAEICAPGSAAPPEARMRWCSGGPWCKVPGSSMCSNHPPVSATFCTPTPPGMQIQGCLMSPPPPDPPRIQVTPNPVTFMGDTTIGTMRGRLVTVQNAGGGTLTVGSARVVTTDPMSLGSFSIPASTCGPTTPLSGTASCTVTVRFQAQSPPGAKQGRLEIPYDDGRGRVESVLVSGTAVAATLDSPGCTTDPATAGGSRRLCFGLGVQRSFTLTATDGPVPVRLAVPAGYTLVAPATIAFTVTPGAPVTVTLRGSSVPVTAGFLVINRDDGGTPVRLELTSVCPVPAGCG